MDKRRITINDVRSAGLCARGSRRYFEGKPISFEKFLSQGATVSELLAFNDAYADSVIERVYGPEAVVRSAPPVSKPKSK